MIRSKLFPVLAFLFTLSWGTVKTQTIDIFISEYSAANINGPTDFKGQHHDWVEIKSTFTSSVSLQNYYLSNDRYNLLKWKFPNDFVLQPGEIRTIWLSGRNVTESGHIHANFTLEQCKNQWLILSTNAGVIRDSIAVRPMMANHSRGRIGNLILGIDEWRVFSTPSFMQPNNANDCYIDYAPKPEIYVSTATSFTQKPNAGGFFNGSQICVIRLNGQKYNQVDNPCFNIFYTVSNYGNNSDRPVEGYPPNNPTRLYVDSTDGPFPIDQSSVVRALCVQNPTATGCGRYHPSFIETNSYFIEPEHQTFDENFGVLSLAFDQADTAWFTDLATRTIHVEYYDKMKQLCEGYAILTNERPPSEKWLTNQKGFYLTMDDRLGFGCGFEGNIFNVEGLGTSTRTMFPTLHVYAGDLEAHSLSGVSSLQGKSLGTGIRDIFLQTLAAKYNLNVNPLHIKPIVTIKEGKYWGLFNFKEVFDRYYEEYYNGQGPDELTMNYVQAGVENHVRYFDNTASAYAPTAWRSEVYNIVMNNPIQQKTNYDKVMQELDQTSLIDYMIVNSFAVNQNLWNYDVAFAKGSNKAAKGGKWHYYLWNMPSTFSYTEVALPGQVNPSMGRSACYYTEQPFDFVPDGSTGNLAFTGIGNVFKKLMTSADPSKLTTYKFQVDYRNRYMDLINGPFKCENMLAHLDFIFKLYDKEYARHEDPANGKFGSEPLAWKGNIDSLRQIIEARCYHFYDPNTSFASKGCFGTPGPYVLTVNVEPKEAGQVRLNRTLLTEYVWTGKYFATPLSFKAIPTNTNYAFHHWEFSHHTPTLPASMDSVAINFNQPDDVVAVFTDKTKDIVGGGEGSNVPTGFTPNGDGLNDVFRPLGSAEYFNNYDMSVFNRWGQEVFRSTTPGVGWDGNYKGQPAITGVYAYVISYTNTFGERKIVKGNVTLTR
jgi:gliding motility-associated-like protein